MPSEQRSPPFGGILRYGPSSRLNAWPAAGSTAHAGGMDITSDELPGFPPDARLLIVNRDDFRTHQAINTAVVASIEGGLADG